MAKRHTTSRSLTTTTFLSIIISEIGIKDVLVSVCVAFLYLSFIAIIPNWKIIGFIFFGSFSLVAKIRIFFDTIQSLYTRQSHFDFWILVISSMLVGLNIVLVRKTLNAIGRLDHVKFTVGGITILSIISSGCASCGLSLLSVVGLSFSFLPFHGIEIHVISVALLVFSLWYMTHRLYLAKYCKIKN